MKKEKFLSELEKKLKGLPQDDLESRLSFYEEAIDDRISCGKSEEEAVSDLGSIDKIVEEIAEQTPYFTLVKERAKLRKKVSLTTILLLILGFPFIITGLILLAVLYLVAWVIVLIPSIISLSLYGASVVCLIAFFFSVADGNALLINLGASFLSVGVGIMLIPAALYSILGFIKLTKFLFIRRKTKLINKEDR